MFAVAHRTTSRRGGWRRARAHASPSPAVFHPPGVLRLVTPAEWAAAAAAMEQRADAAAHGRDLPPPREEACTR
jgi:hypothetical protein